MSPTIFRMSKGTFARLAKWVNSMQVFSTIARFRIFTRRTTPMWPVSVLGSMDFRDVTAD